MLTPKQRSAIWLFAIGCALLVAGILLWVASGSPTTADICDEGGQAKIENCATYNIILITFWHLREWLHSIEGIITALATAAIAAFTWTLWQSSEKMWGVTKISAEAAKKSADASLLALRPWVSCEVSIISDLTYRSNGDPCITIQFTLKNIGRSPAMGVQLLHWFNLLSPVHTHSIHAQQRIADLFKGLPAQDHGLLLFPGGTHTCDVELPISRIEIERSIEDIKPKRHFFPELVGLVSYTYPLATHNPQTGFIFYLRKIVPDETYGFAF
jgi:hypothetical protein